MSAGSREARASRTLLSTGLKLAEFTGGRAKSAPFKEFRQPYFGSLHENNNTLTGETPPSDFLEARTRRGSNSSKSPPPPSKPGQSPRSYTRPPPRPNWQSQF